jgi:hypothetical protein
MIPNVLNAPPSPADRKKMISESNIQQLEGLRGHALAMMQAFLNEKKQAHGDYAIWDAFVREIEAEQGKRVERSN